MVTLIDGKNPLNIDKYIMHNAVAMLCILFFFLFLFFFYSTTETHFSYNQIKDVKKQQHITLLECTHFNMYRTFVRTQATEQV